MDELTMIPNATPTLYVRVFGWAGTGDWYADIHVEAEPIVGWQPSLEDGGFRPVLLQSNGWAFPKGDGEDRDFVGIVDGRLSRAEVERIAREAWDEKRKTFHAAQQREAGALPAEPAA